MARGPAKGSKRPEGAGRKKGTPNKTTRAVRDALESVYEMIGGAEFFADWAKQNPTEFYKIWAKLLPLQLTGANDSAIEFIVKVANDPGE